MGTPWLALTLSHDTSFSSRKSSSWHTSLRIRKKSEKKDKEVKKETKLENGYRKSRDGLANKVSVKVCFSSTRELAAMLQSFMFSI